MNHIYCTVWNNSLGCWQVAAEIAKGRHKQGAARNGRAFLRSMRHPLALAIALLSGAGAWAAPQGGQVSAGAASIAQQGAVTNIHQSTQNAAINWQSFGVQAHETVNFHQPNAESVTLNRVLGNERSVIDGAMNANGKVFIQNPSGVLIGKGAQINVGGLVATTQHISDDDFMSGNYRFQGNGNGEVANLGQITVPPGGVVALIAPISKNHGKIEAPQGKVLLASANAFRITLPGELFSYTVDQSSLQGLVDNGGAILADGGRVVLTSKGVDNVKKSVIKHSGNIQANTLAEGNRKGSIELLGDLDNSRLELSGSLKAEAPQGGDGGFIETSAALFNIDPNALVSTQAAHGKTGEWLIDPNDFTVAASGGDITGAQVSAALANNNLTLKSTEGKAQGKGDVVINDTIAWDANTLTLNAQKDIHINKTIRGTGTAKLAIEYGQADVDGTYGEYYLNNDSKVYLPAGNNFSIKEGSAGVTEEFKVIHQMPEIQADGKAIFDDENIAMGADMDLSYTAAHNNFQGWTPLHGTKVHGLGHDLKNLNINSKNNGTIGLFRYLQNGEVRDLSLTNLRINIKEDNGSIFIGGITGNSSNSIFANNKIKGNINLESKENNFANIIGGIVGVASSTKYDNRNSFVIYNNNVDIDIDGGDLIGGVIGSSYTDKNSIFIIRNNKINADLNQKNNNGFNAKSVGGIVGKTSGDSGLIHILKNTSSFDIKSTNNAGGIVGTVDSQKLVMIGNVAKGNIIQKNSNNNRPIGGLIGTINLKNNREILVDKNNFSGNIESIDIAGGLIGEVGFFSDGSNILVSNNYAEGSINSLDLYSSGIIGFIGNYTGQTNNKNNKVRIKNSYSATELKSKYQPQGISVIGDRLILDNVYYDMNKTGVKSATSGQYSEDFTKKSAKTSEEMKQKATFEGWDFTNVWEIREGVSSPTLRNVGFDNTGSGNTGSGNTGSGNTGSGNTGSGNTGSGNTGSGNTGSGNTGSGNTGSGNAGSGNAGSGNASGGNADGNNPSSTNTTINSNESSGNRVGTSFIVPATITGSIHKIDWDNSNKIGEGASASIGNLMSQLGLESIETRARQLQIIPPPHTLVSSRDFISLKKGSIFFSDKYPQYEPWYLANMMSDLYQAGDKAKKIAKNYTNDISDDLRIGRMGFTIKEYVNAVIERSALNREYSRYTKADDLITDFYKENYDKKILKNWKEIEKNVDLHNQKIRERDNNQYEPDVAWNIWKDSLYQLWDTAKFAMEGGKFLVENFTPLNDGVDHAKSIYNNLLYGSQLDEKINDLEQSMIIASDAIDFVKSIFDFTQSLASANDVKSAVDVGIKSNEVLMTILSKLNKSIDSNAVGRVLDASSIANNINSITNDLLEMDKLLKAKKSILETPEWYLGQPEKEVLFSIIDIRIYQVSGSMMITGSEIVKSIGGLVIDKDSNMGKTVMQYADRITGAARLIESGADALANTHYSNQERMISRYYYTVKDNQSQYVDAAKYKAEAIKNIMIEVGKNIGN